MGNFVRTGIWIYRPGLETFGFAVVFVDAIVRLLPGVLGHEQSAADDSFSGGLLEGPQYTRPSDFRGWKVPDVLLSGNHAAIEKWRKGDRAQPFGGGQLGCVSEDRLARLLAAEPPAIGARRRRGVCHATNLSTNGRSLLTYTTGRAIC